MVNRIFGFPCCTPRYAVTRIWVDFENVDYVCIRIRTCVTTGMYPIFPFYSYFPGRFPTPPHLPSRRHCHTCRTPPPLSLNLVYCRIYACTPGTTVQPPRDSWPQEQEDAGAKGKGALAGAKRDHINALGLPNDGYNYDQHLKSMGEGDENDK